jgi:hypothetical protein
LFAGTVSIDDNTLKDLGQTIGQRGISEEAFLFRMPAVFFNIATLKKATFALHKKKQLAPFLTYLKCLKKSLSSF